MIEHETLVAVRDRIASAAPSEDMLRELRRTWPGMHFTLCSDDDIPPHLPPALTGAGFNLYLVNSSEHCMSLTTIPALASGVVLATVEEE
ncbi:MAG: DUF6129 family protein [Thiotrichales bacterium]